MRWVLVVLAAATPARADPAAWTLTLEGGSEYDTNAHRAETGTDAEAPVVAAPLARAAARARTGWRLDPRNALAASAVVAGKLFADDAARSESVAVVSGDGRYERRLGDGGGQVSLRGSWYDAIALDDAGGGARTFSTGAGALELGLNGPGAHRLAFSAGLRRFQYKPNHDFDWDGDVYGVRYSTAVWFGDPDADLDASSLDINADYRLERRGYQGAAFANACAPGAEPAPMCFVPTRIGRADLFHALGVELVYTGERVWSARYELQVDDSNSFGQSLVRNRFELSLTTELFARIFLTAKGVAQLNHFLDPLLLAQDVAAQTFVSIDDENRNALILHASRAVSQRWSVEGRYELFRNEFATQDIRFRRQTAYLGLVYGWSRDTSR